VRGAPRRGNLATATWVHRQATSGTLIERRRRTRQPQRAAADEVTTTAKPPLRARIFWDDGRVPPPGRFLSARHHIRYAHPLRRSMRRSLARMERASAGEIVAYQERRLRMLVRLAAARSPYYRDWFAEAGVDPRSIRTLADLGRLPLLERGDVMEHRERFRAYPRRLMWEAVSSGTSGRVVRVDRTPGSSAYEISALERQWGWFGLPSRSPRLVLRAADADIDGTGALTRVVPGAHQMVVSSYRLDSMDTSRLLEEVRAFGPRAIEGWPSSITLLAGRLREMGEQLPVTAVITSSEVMTTEQEALMRSVFVGPVVDHYGQTERVAMAGRCEGGGYHEFPDYGIVERVPVPGAAGRWEIVGTPLHNWGFPLFRYRTGDEVGVAPQGPCPCGREFALLGAIDGRVEDAFTAADGHLLPLPATVVDDLPGLLEAQVAQLAAGRFEIRLVPTAHCDLAAVQAHALRNVEQYFGPGQQVSFQVMDSIPRSASGKLKSAVVVGT
jgi:phenylacetate-CoA ligase